jgi:hypothetical protein
VVVIAAAGDQAHGAIVGGAAVCGQAQAWVVADHPHLAVKGPALAGSCKGNQWLRHVSRRVCARSVEACTAPLGGYNFRRVCQYFARLPCCTSQMRLTLLGAYIQERLGGERQEGSWPQGPATAGSGWRTCVSIRSPAALQVIATKLTPAAKPPPGASTHNVENPTDLMAVLLVTNTVGAAASKAWGNESAQFAAALASCCYMCVCCHAVFGNKATCNQCDNITACFMHGGRQHQTPQVLSHTHMYKQGLGLALMLCWPNSSTPDAAATHPGPSRLA